MQVILLEKIERLGSLGEEVRVRDGFAGNFLLPQNKALRARFPQYNSGQMSRILRRLRTHGLIKKASHCYKYYMTVLGKQAVALGLKLKQLVIIPELAVSH